MTLVCRFYIYFVPWILLFGNLIDFRHCFALVVVYLCTLDKTYLKRREKTRNHNWTHCAKMKFSMVVFVEICGSKHTHHFYKQRLFASQPQCRLNSSWNKLQMLFRCCLISITIIIIILLFFNDSVDEESQNFQMAKVQILCCLDFAWLFCQFQSGLTFLIKMLLIKAKACTYFLSQ